MYGMTGHYDMINGTSIMRKKRREGEKDDVNDRRRYLQVSTVFITPPGMLKQGILVEELK